MKTFLLAAVLAASLSGCAIGERVGLVRTGPDGFDRGALTFAGWVRTAGGEFRLYADPADLARPNARACVSGALNPDAAGGAEIDGRHVRFTGRTEPWNARDHAPTLTWQGTRLHNLCGGRHVILAEGVEVLE